MDTSNLPPFPLDRLARFTMKNYFGRSCEIESKGKNLFEITLKDDGTTVAVKFFKGEVIQV